MACVADAGVRSAPVHIAVQHLVCVSGKVVASRDDQAANHIENPVDMIFYLRRRRRIGIAQL